MSKNQLKIGILGAAGRMGQMIAREILSRRYDAALAACVDSPKSWANGKDIGGILGGDPAGVTVTTDKDAGFKASDVIIDFTSIQGVIEHTSLAVLHKKCLVVGTTGLTPLEEAALKTAGERTAVLYSANMSLGVNLLVSLVEQVARKLNDDYDIEIFDAHHRLKVDAPSGTALALANSAAKGRNVKLEDVMVPARFGNVGARVPGSIGISVFRGGDVIGDHTVTFAGSGERLELTHRASDRGLFAKGALRAALWIKDKPAGLYSMRDVLGL